MATPSETLATAQVHLQAGRLPEAEAIFQEVLTVEPHHATCLHGLGLIAFRRLEWARAVDLLELAVRYNPDNAHAHAQLAAALQNNAQPDEALKHFERALASRPDDPETHHNMGMTLRVLGRLEEAAEHYRRALDLRPNYPEAHAAFGVVMLALGRPEEAIVSLRRALALRPEDPDSHNDLGVVLMDQGRPEEAIARYEQALALRPDYTEAHFNYGTALTHEGRFDEAVVRFQRVLALKPDHVDALLKLSGAFGTLLRREDAVESLERALKIKPDIPLLRIGLCMAQLPILYRDVAEIAACRLRYEECLTRLSGDFDQGRVEGDLAAAVGSSHPFYLAYQGYNDRDLQRVYGTLMCRAVARSYPDVQLPAAPGPGEKVRVGIVAGLFRNHTVWKLLIKGWLTQLDLQKFQVFGYHTAAQQDGETERARKLCDRFVQGPLSVGRWREEIGKDAPHVLIYPDIGMDPGAGQLGAQRLAPVQCLSWGHPNTSGYPTMDYFLSSELMEPRDGDDHYVERLVRLPNLGLYYEPLEVPSMEVDRAQLGLRSDAIVYWSGQSLFKYLPQYDEIYPRIAREVGNCQFAFIRFHAGSEVTRTFRSRLEQAFAAFGLNAADHCVFLPRLPTEVFVAAVGVCDVVLDVPTWSGGNTTLEGLAHDTPIVTWPGPLMRGRHTAAILRRMGIAETIADTIDDYVAISVRLAHDSSWRTSVKQRMAATKGGVYRDRAYISALEDFLWSTAHGEALPRDPARSGQVLE
jgi:predicted O-linked N-acetylglucosamine transferase (SPINDLY family)